MVETEDNPFVDNHQGGPFQRKELQAIRERALDSAEPRGTSPSWKRAYLRLADAANCLDAMRSRTEIHPGRVLSVGHK